MRERWRRHRLPVLLGSLLVGVLALSALLAGSRPGGALDPDSYDPDGAHALAVLLQQRGVEVARTSDVPATVRAARRGSTVFVPLPWLLSPEELAALAEAPGRLVVTEARPEQLKAMSLAVEVTGATTTADRDPRCSDPVAANAGRALAGGLLYRARGATSCYPSEDGGSLLVRDRVALLGAAEALTNDHLDEAGNAALGIGLLGRGDRVVWLIPSPTRAAFGERPVRSPEELLPHWLHLVRWQLLVAAVVLVLWRGRRLGRVVLEQLPVVVRASETVEGHGRLYQAAGARDTAAEALRGSARRVLERLAHGGAVTPDVLTGLVAQRTGRDAVAVRSLLYGPTPGDDAALVRLARELDVLVRDTLTREGAGT